MTPFFLFFGLMVATGFIAHWSDNLGKKLGKKRVSLFGLRPKQTATLITVASSLLIMTVTFAAMLGVYKPLREALLSFDKERADNRRLALQNKNLNEGFALLETRQKNLQRRSRQLNANLKNTNADLSKTQINLKQARTAETQARKAETLSRQNERNARAGERDAKRGLGQAKRGETQARRNERSARQSERDARNLEQFARNRETQARQGETRARQNETRARQAETVALRNQTFAQRKFAFAQRQLKQAESGLKTAQTNLKTAQSDVKVAQTNLKETQQKYFDQGTKLLAGESELAQRRAQLDLQTVKLGKLEEDIAQRQTQVANLQTQAIAAEQYLLRAAKSLVGPTLVSNRETLAVKIIPARLDAATVENLLRDLVLSARLKVKQLGEENKRLGLDLDVVPREVQTDAGIIEADEKYQLNVLRQSLGGSQAFSVRVVAARNHGIDEPDIKVAFEVVPIQTAYQRDEVIATSVIDGRRTDARRNAAKIFNQLLALVNEGQRLAEKDRKVEPPLGRDTQFYASDTNERIFDAINDIQALGGMASVRLRAAEDLSTAAPLRVRFEVLPATANA